MLMNELWSKYLGYASDIAARGDLSSFTYCNGFYRCRNKAPAANLKVGRISDIFKLINPRRLAKDSYQTGSDRFEI